MKAFTDHPQSVGETYWQHMGVALSFAGSMFLGAAASLVHAIFPFLCTKTGSSIVMALHERIARRSRQPLLQETDPARLPHLGLDTVFGLELIEEFVGGERGRQDVDLPLDGGKVTRTKLVHPGEARRRFGHQA